MVIRVMAVPDYLDLPAFDEVFRSILGLDGLGFIFRVHGQEGMGMRSRLPRRPGRGSSGVLWWSNRLPADAETTERGQIHVHTGAGRSGHRDDFGVGPEVPMSTWDLLRRTLDEGINSIDKRLEQYGPLDPECSL